MTETLTNNLIYFSEGFTMGTIAYALYLELSPTIGDIWYRKNHKNDYELHLHNLLRCFTLPFTSTIFWYPKYWDINPYTFSTIVGITFTTLRNYY